MDENIRSAEEALMNLSMDEETRRKYELREKFIADEASRMYGAEEVGIVKGKKEAKEEFALSLFKENMPLEFISRNTGFSIEELKKMK